MTKDEVDKALSLMRANRTLYFSQRLAVENVFEAHCRERNLAVSVSNFLSWLVTSEIGGDVMLSLVSERGR